MQEPVVSRQWVPEEQLELWQIRYFNSVYVYVRLYSCLFVCLIVCVYFFYIHVFRCYAHLNFHSSLQMLVLFYAFKALAAAIISFCYNSDKNIKIIVVIIIYECCLQVGETK